MQNAVETRRGRNASYKKGLLISALRMKSGQPEEQTQEAAVWGHERLPESNAEAETLTTGSIQLGKVEEM